MDREVVDFLDDYRLLKLAESRVNSNTIDLEDVIKEEGFSIEELEMLSENIEFE